MVAAVETMFSGEGQVPWHGLGTLVEGLATSAEALKLAGLDWTVEKQDIYLAGGVVIPDRYAIVRTTDNKPLGVVGGNYTPFQNTEAFAFFDTVTDAAGEARYSTAGSLFGGKRVFMTAKIGDTFNVAGDDAHNLYLVIANSHDGSQAFTAATTMIRVVCNNTLTLGLATAKTRWNLHHRTTLEGKAQEAREALKLSYKYFDAFEAEVEKLMQIQVDTDKFLEIIDGVLPDQKRQKEKNVEALTSIWETEPTIVETSAAGNGWGVLNAITFWTDHTKEYRAADARFKSIYDGFAAKLRNDTRDAVLSLA